jgi:hypothetical protein
MLKIAIIIGSTRPGRRGEAVTLVRGQPPSRVGRGRQRLQLLVGHRVYLSAQRRGYQRQMRPALTQP